ncbi:MAG: carbohydrate-binding domain-containing protein [Ilumatobacter sp.]|nr:carbohydrate-binding domain-containing protein [Ilumatobacter sp.]
MTRKQRPTVLRAAVLATILAVAGCGRADSAQSDTGGAAEGAAAAAEATDDEAGSVIAVSATDVTSSAEIGAVTAANQESHFDTDDLDDESQVVEISLDDTSASSESGDVTVDGSTVTITTGGTYSLSGILSDGQVVVDAADSDDVTLVLEGVDITNADGAAIAVLTADETIVLLADGSTNRLTDGAAYVFADADTDEPNATLYSAADLTIAGDGELVVTGNYNDGIAGKDGLVIASGSIEVVAADDGIRGKDYVIIDGGTIDVDAAGDAIKADNEDDADRGYVQVNGGVVGITAGDDGVEATTDVLVTGGELTIDAGTASGTGRAIQGDVMVVVSGGVIDATAVDDAIHSNNEVAISGGTVTLASGDDGVHGDTLVTIDGGSITITDAYEGIESEVIAINDGFIDITSNDDGLNVASADAAATTEPGLVAQPPPGGGGGRGGAGGGAGGPGGAEAVGDHYIYINGGTTVITITGDLAEQGDGIDANGHVEMSGGVVVVSGPTDTRNSAIDYSGGSFVMTGGTFIGTNIDGRNSEGVGVGSSQASMYLTTGTTITAGTIVHIETTDGEGLITFEPANDYSVIVFSSPDVVDGESYDIYLAGTVTGGSATGLYQDSVYTAGDLAGTAVAVSG